jgi:hypothetical protein
MTVDEVMRLPPVQWIVRGVLPRDGLAVVYGPSGIWALEVKSSDRVKSEDLRGLNAFLDDYPEAKGILLYRGTARLKEGRIHCLPVENFLRGLTPQKELV